MSALAAQKSLSMHILISTIGLLVALSACVEMPAPRPLAPTAGFTGSPHAVVPIDVDGEVARLRADLMREVPGVIVNSLRLPPVARASARRSCLSSSTATPVSSKCALC